MPYAELCCSFANNRMEHIQRTLYIMLVLCVIFIFIMQGYKFMFANYVTYKQVFPRIHTVADLEYGCSSVTPQTLQDRIMPKDAAYYINVTRNCTEFRNTGYLDSSPTEEETNFTLAFSIIMYTQVNRAERLLRAIYQPHNFYCIHVDKRSGEKLQEAMSGIASCFDNVFVIDEPVPVLWGTYSVLQAELLCMELLWKFQWKYFINLTGQEFPLKTNWELVQILKVYNGANDVDGTSKEYDQGIRLHRYNNTLDQLPSNITISKGSVHAVLQRGFIDYALHNPKSKEFLDWLRYTMIPDESFFPSLNLSPQLGVPGAYTGEPVRSRNKPHIARYKLWFYYEEDPYDWYPEGGFPKCHGKYLRDVCLLGNGDLQNLIKTPHMFANKFSSYFQPEAYDYLECWHKNKIIAEAYGHRAFDTKYYQELDFVKHHI